ncbi:DUF732 domain-containing protein [Rhodococcus sp. NPDC047139]|uniref:DUF732 domain-containing protein n=1 Tax=Rhodococcus sp. NPDC047139 TaxID=3155141 RepID=UPI0033DCDA30
MADRAERSRARAVLSAWIVAVAGAVPVAACGSAAPTTPDAADAAISTAPTTDLPTPPDARFLRVKEALDSAGLVADVNDDTVLAVVRGVCDQLATGVPEPDVLATLRPIAAYAAAASGTQMSADDAALRYLETTRETYC